MPARLRPDRPIRVAAVPGEHPYVRSLVEPGSTTVRMLDDPPARDGATDRWWPPAMLSAAWVTTHADDFDVMHVHFGMESSTTDELAAVLAALAAAGKPLVYTVHDLENPQLTDQAIHREHLDLLVPAADALVTLTSGARGEIDRRWARSARVIGHPRVASTDALDAAASGSVGTRAADGTTEAIVIVHLRDLRPNIDGLGTVRALAAAADRAEQTSPFRVIVDVNENVRDEAQLAEIASIVDAASRLTLQRHARYDDAALAASLSAATVAVLPYRFGTHSGWAELCWDLGVPVVTAPVGFIAEQHPADSFVVDPADGGSVAAALETALATATAPGSPERHELVEAREQERRVQRTAITREHESLYREVLR
ncbi:glycosyltransferase [Labedella endophytica]|uniref:D-inositol 3-phosphate glycosyltransferase n=1 Tax=Labedella endophytica TaxID=1523160 RepID=A0A3S0VRR0_9MICO|nr:glycosyltransferase [Labedella endophytica]RUQ98274.1 hypothetical protein ELQ94_14815 [Labedella endophytica]